MDVCYLPKVSLRDVGEKGVKVDGGGETGPEVLILSRID